MALSQADFYAYSRATGAPVPRDPEEQAQMAPEVLQFRRNQLKSPETQEEQGFGLPQALGVGAALAGVGAAGFGISRLLRQKPAAAAKGSVIRPATVDIESPVRRIATEVQTTSAAAPEVPPSRIPDPWGATTTPPRQAAQGFSPRQYAESTGALATRMPSRIVMQNPRIVRSGVAEDLTSIQDNLLAQTRDQLVNAVESGEDQQTGRIKTQLQRNEDYDLSQVELLEEMAERSRIQGMEQDEPITRVAATLPDDVPFDQTDIQQTSAARFLEKERLEIASELGEQGLIITPSRVDAELANRLGKNAYQYGPKYTARKQNLELYAQTGDPKLLNQIQRFGLSPVTFETFENMPVAKRAGFESAPPFSTSYYPSEELTPVGLSSDIEINLPGQGRVSLAETRKPVIMQQTAEAAEEYYQEKKGKALDWLGNLRVQLEPQRNQILKERRQLAEQSASEILPLLEQAKAAGDRQAVGELETQVNTLRAIWKNPRLGEHRAGELRKLDAQIAGAQREINQSISQIQKKYPTTIGDWSGDASRVFGELDPNTGEFIPETMEVRSERPAKLLPQKGGSGRNIAEYTVPERIDEEIRAIQGGGRIRDYDPETGAPVQRWQPATAISGREIDIYGIRPSAEKAADPSKRPSEPQYTKQEIYSEAMRLSEADPQGDVPIAPDYDAVIKSLGYQEPTAARRASVLASEAVRKGQMVIPKTQGPSQSMRAVVMPKIEEVKTEPPQWKTTVNVGPREWVEVTDTRPQTYQLPLASNIVPSTAAAARTRTSPADLAAQQLESYMSKLQRGRSTPLTSQAVIQPRLF